MQQQVKSIMFSNQFLHKIFTKIIIYQTSENEKFHLNKTTNRQPPILLFFTFFIHFFANHQRIN